MRFDGQKRALQREDMVLAGFRMSREGEKLEAYIPRVRLHFVQRLWCVCVRCTQKHSVEQKTRAFSVTFVVIWSGIVIYMYVFVRSGHHC